MSDMVVQKNIASMLTIRVASAFAALTAGGAGNATPVVGTTFQRSLMGMPISAALVLAYTATLAAAKTLAFSAVTIQHSPDGATWTTYSTIVAPAVSATGPTGGGTMAGEVTLNAYLEGAQDYVRVVYTPTLSNTATDTATAVAAFVFSGFRLLPAAQ